MNREDILNSIPNILGSFDLYPDIEQEILSYIVGSGYEQQFFKLLISRLRILSLQGLNAVKHEEFENIGKGLFSLHLSGKGFNLRILYAFLPNKKPTLLCCFYERAGKRKTQYDEYIPQSLERLNSRLEVYKNA